MHVIPAETTRSLFSPFLRSHLRTGAQRRNLHYAGSIPVLHFVTTFQVHRCAPPVLRLHYGRGKTHFQIPMKKQKPNKTKDTGARRLLRGSQTTAIVRAATLRTSHSVRAPTRVRTSLRRGKPAFTRPKPRAAKRSTDALSTPFQTSARRSQVVSLVS